LILSHTEAVRARRGSNVLTRLESSRLALESEQEIQRDRLLFEIPGPGMSRDLGGDDVGEMYTRGRNIPVAWCWVAAMSSWPASKFTPSPQRSSCSSVSTTTAAVSEGGGGGLVQPVLGRGPAALTKAMTQSRGRRPLFLCNLLCVPSRWWYLSNCDEERVSGLLDNSRATAVVGDRAFPSPGVAIAAHLARTGFSRRPAQDCRG